MGDIYDGNNTRKASRNAPAESYRAFLAKIINDISQKYNITPRGLYQDWAGRARWIKAILSLKDPELFFLDCLSTHREIYKRASIEYFKGDNSAAKIGALRLLRDLNRDLFEMVSVHDLIIRVDRIEEKVGE